VTISYPSTTSNVGDPVKVEVTAPYTFRAIMKLGTIQLSAQTTMRLEQKPSRFTENSTPTTCP
jgi:hypothetical protein